MKVALVHDYLNEFGGAERVLEALTEIYPKAPIYTAFYRKNGSAYKRLKHKKIITSWAQNVPFFASKLHSPLRFLAHNIWSSFDFSEYDLILTSASWYITKGVAHRGERPSLLQSGSKRQDQDLSKEPVEICYCHTPPRYLYGYKTSIDWQKYWIVKAYAVFINHFIRMYDFEAAQRVDYFVANSREVEARISKFYRRKSKVIYPPVDVEKYKVGEKGDYFLTVSRLAGAKNVELIVKVCKKMNLPLKVVGTGRDEAMLREMAKDSEVEILGEVDDKELVKLYEGCWALIFASSQEDFGIVPVEAMAAGKPVIALAEGGVLETVIDKKTGVYFYEATIDSLEKAINSFIKLGTSGLFDSQAIRKHAMKFSKERFKIEIKKFAESKVHGKNS